MPNFQKIKKLYVSGIDFFIKKTFIKDPTASQQDNIARSKHIAKLRDHKIKSNKKSSIWDNF